MGSATTPARDEALKVNRQRQRRRGVIVIPHVQERRLYFVATLVLVGWYLLDRLF
jgi:stress response protein YsnF